MMNQDTVDTWDDDAMVEQMKALYLGGQPTSAIAKVLNKQFGATLTRNSVIGKLSRLGVVRSGSTSPTRAPKAPVVRTEALRIVNARAVAAKARVEREPAPPPDPIPERPQEGPGSATLLTLAAHMCKWPIGDPGTDGFTFCGRQHPNEGPYCSHHRDIAYVPSKPGKRYGATELARSLRRYV